MKRYLLIITGLIAFLLVVALATRVPAIPAATPEPVQETDVRVQPAAETRSLTVADIAQTGRPQFLNAYATWCPYCQQNDPIVFALQSQFKDQVDFIHLNVDGPGVLEGAAPYTITGVTQYVLIDSEGEIIEKWFGTITHDSLSESISAYLDSV